MIRIKKEDLKNILYKWLPKEEIHLLGCIMSDLRAYDNLHNKMKKELINDS